jgi:hypothetical protein
MARKKRGHYCFGCDRHRANEKFSGKGHRNHLCKDCKSKGKAKQKKKHENYKSPYNRYMKSLKVRLVVFTGEEGYIFFEIGGKGYAITSDLEELLSTGMDLYIYRCQEDIDPPYALATELQEDSIDVIEAIMTKCENPYDQAIDLDRYDLNDPTEIKLSAKQKQYLKLLPNMVAFDRKYREEYNDYR